MGQHSTRNWTVLRVEKGKKIVTIASVYAKPITALDETLGSLEALARENRGLC